MKILSFALRNLGRNPNRTIVTVGAMAFAGAIMILYVALVEGFIDTLERNMITMSLGDIQIHAVGYRDDPDLYKRIDGASTIIGALNARGFNAAGRLYGFGLAASGLSSAGVSLRGVDIEMERTVTKVHRHLLEGSWLDAGDPFGVVLGRKLARTLGVGVGGEIVIVSQAADGSMANDLYRVRGVLKSIGEAIDRAGFFMIEPAFRELMAVPDGVHEIAVIRLDRAVDIEVATQRVRDAAKGLETKNWRELQPIIAKLLDQMAAMDIIMLLIVYAAIAMVTLNATLMSVFERIREFGIMKALGVSPWQVMSLVYTEAMLQAAIACVLAAALGVPLSFYFQEHGLDLTAITANVTEASIAGVAMDPVWYATVTYSSVFYPLAVLAAIVAVAAVYPGVKAAVIQPVKAVHYL